MADVFISYKREEANHAGRLASVLEQLGYSVWWDVALLSGDEFRDVIREMIDRCAAVVVLWSPLAVTSRFVVDEASYANRKDKLLPAMLQPADLPFGLGSDHVDSLQGWSGQINHPGFQRLLAAIEKKTGKTAQMGAPPPQSAAQKAEIAAFQAVAKLRSPGAWRAFLADYPGSMFRSFIDAQVAELEQDDSSGAAPPRPAPPPSPPYQSPPPPAPPAPVPGPAWLYDRRTQLMAVSVAGVVVVGAAVAAVAGSFGPPGLKETCKTLISGETRAIEEMTKAGTTPDAMCACYEKSMAVLPVRYRDPYVAVVREMVRIRKEKGLALEEAASFINNNNTDTAALDMAAKGFTQDDIDGAGEIFEAVMDGLAAGACQPERVLQKIKPASSKTTL
jgi:hypothetical protein